MGGRLLGRLFIGEQRRRYAILSLRLIAREELIRAGILAAENFVQLTNLTRQFRTELPPRIAFDRGFKAGNGIR